MQVPTWLKPAIMGAVAGGIATMIVGFNYGGWYLGSSAEALANKQSNAAVLTALVPVCVSQSQADPEGATKLKAFSVIKSTYEQRDFVMKAGWATMPRRTHRTRTWRRPAPTSSPKQPAADEAAIHGEGGPAGLFERCRPGDTVRQPQR